MAEPSTRGGRARRAAPAHRVGRYVLRAAVAYLFLLVAWPVSSSAAQNVRRRAHRRPGHPRRPRRDARAAAHGVRRHRGGGHQHRVRRGHVDPAGALPVPGPAALNALVDLPVSCRRSSSACRCARLRRPRQAGSVPGSRTPASRSSTPHPASCSRPCSWRCRWSCARSSPCSRRRASSRSRPPGASAPTRCDLPAHHAAHHPVGRRLRRRAQPRPLARRVRRGEGRVGERPRRDPDATLVVEEKYLNFDKGGAYATAFLLALVSVACIVVVSFVRPKENELEAAMSIEVSPRRQAVRRLRRPRRRDGQHPPPGSSPRCSGRAAAASPRCCASSRARPGGRGHGRDRGHRRHVPAAAEAQRRLRVPALRGVQAHDRAPQRGVRAGDPAAAEGRDPPARSTSCSSSCTSSSSPTGCRRSSRRPAPAHGAGAGAGGGARPCCCSTSRSARSTPRCARSCATGCAGCTTRCT